MLNGVRTIILGCLILGASLVRPIALRVAIFVPATHSPSGSRPVAVGDGRGREEGKVTLSISSLRSRSKGGIGRYPSSNRILACWCLCSGRPQWLGAGRLGGAPG
jgi:hypothetical protein